MEPRLYSCWTDDGINPGGLEDFCHGYKTRPTAIHSTSKGKEKCVVMPSLLEAAQKASYELLWGRFRCQEKQKMLVIYLAFYCSVPPGLYWSPNGTLSLGYLQSQRAHSGEGQLVTEIKVQGLIFVPWKPPH